MVGERKKGKKNRVKSNWEEVQQKAFVCERKRKGGIFANDFLYPILLSMKPHSLFYAFFALKLYEEFFSFNFCYTEITCTELSRCKKDA